MARRTIKWPRPWDATVLEEHEVHALKAFGRGTASDVQQRMVLEALMKICGQGRPSFWPEDSHATALAEGKRFVWLQVIGIINRVMPETPQGSPSPAGKART
jgi:hypothetical protein